MKKYITEYKISRVRYGSHIWAKSLKEAERIASIRNLDEKILGQSISTKRGNKALLEEEVNVTFRSITDYEFLLQLPKIIHSATFLSFICLRAKIMSAHEVVGDGGILHELIHLLNGSQVTTRLIRRAKGAFYKLQENTPGYLK